MFAFAAWRYGGGYEHGLGMARNDGEAHLVTLRYAYCFGLASAWRSYELNYVSK